jgi:hypothetical protein
MLKPKTIYRHTLVLEFLSETFVSESEKLDTLLWRARESDMSYRCINVAFNYPLTGKAAADATRAQNSDPEFFQMDHEGNALDDDGNPLHEITANTPVELWWTADDEDERNQWAAEIFKNGDPYPRCLPEKDCSRIHVYITTTVGKAFTFYREDPRSLYEDYFDEEYYPDGLEQMQRIYDTLNK